MYKSFYSLKAEPFGATPDPEFLAVTPQVQEALASLEYVIRFRKGIAALTGEVGTGKTTLLRAALHKLQGAGEKDAKPQDPKKQDPKKHDAKVHFAYVFNPRLEVLDFLEFVLMDFGLVPGTRTKASMLMQLNRWLIECYGRGEICVLLVDEAQECSWDLLEEIRLLTNLETAAQKLLQVVLSGQPELEDRLRERHARQLLQRVVVWARTFPLGRDETRRYIRKRLELAGTADPIFTEDAVETVYQLSRGIPRIINLVCEHALILGFVRQKRQIDAAMVKSGSSDLLLFLPSQPDSAPAVSPAAGVTQGNPS